MGAPKFCGSNSWILLGKSSLEELWSEAKYDREEVREAILLVPYHKRMNLRKLVSAIAIPLTTSHRMKTDPDDNVIIPHLNAIRPHLHDYHQLARVLYAVENLDLDDLCYRASFDCVHIDEKCFFLQKLNLTFILCRAKPSLQDRLGTSCTS
jgi:hypothetical protein